MKKLNLGKLKLVAEDVLQRNQMTTIYGGSGGQTCTLTCDNWQRGINISHCSETMVWFHCGSEQGASCTCA